MADVQAHHAVAPHKGRPGTWSVLPAALIETTAATLTAPVRRHYSRRLDQVANAPLSIGAPIDLSVMSFLQERDVPEFVASVRSFLEHVGIPREFVVVSDGTITPQSRDVISSILPDVLSVQSVDAYVGGHQLPGAVRDFMARSPWGAKLASIMALNDRTPALYADSDLWYFPRAGELRDICSGEVPLFMQDIAPFLDERILTGDSMGDKTDVPLNAGFLFVPKPLDWTLSSARLAALSGEPIGDSEQAAVHLTFLNAGARPSPPATSSIPAGRSRESRSRGASPASATTHGLNGDCSGWRSLGSNLADDAKARGCDSGQAELATRGRLPNFRPTAAAPADRGQSVKDVAMQRAVGCLDWDAEVVEHIRPLGPDGPVKLILSR